MPEMSGLTVLEKIRATPDGQHVPIVVYTTSSDQPQVDLAYSAGANSFVTKPSSLRDMTVVLEGLVACWFKHGRLPSWPGKKGPGGKAPGGKGPGEKGHGEKAPSTIEQGHNE